MNNEDVKVQINIPDNFIMPKMMKIKQIFNNNRLENIEEKMSSEILKVDTYEKLNGKRLAITAGSRGIVNIDFILKILVKKLKEYGANPFIVPAMGSHGGATAKGQIEVLESYNITEEYLEAPIISSMETVKIGETNEKMPVFCDKVAFNADGIIVVNKIKPHTDFKADYESGLLKMMGIGLGKHKGASMLHSKGFNNFPSLIPETGKCFIENTNIIFGLGILQNAYDEILDIEVISSERILEREKELLKIAKENVARLLMKKIDVLIIDEIGKNISGSGMDANVTGRPGSGLKEGFIAPEIQKIIVRGVSEESHGNGVGIGMADLTTRNCVNQIDFGAMYTNSLTATILNPSKIPMTLNTDKDAIVAAIMTCNNIDINKARIVRIKNTLELQEIEVSEVYKSEINKNDYFELISEPYEIKFKNNGNLI